MEALQETLSLAGEGASVVAFVDMFAIVEQAITRLISDKAALQASLEMQEREQVEMEERAQTQVLAARKEGLGFRV